MKNNLSKTEILRCSSILLTVTLAMPLLAGCSGGSLNSGSVQPSYYDNIVFLANYGALSRPVVNDPELVAITAGGSVAPVTSHGVFTSLATPRLSPNGRQVAFEATRGGVDGIYIINRDGSSPVLLVAGGKTPAWSPDGAKIAFAKKSKDNLDQIFVVASDGAGPQSQLTNMAGLSCSAPSYSPGGDEIAFGCSSTGGTGDVYTMDLSDRAAATDVTRPLGQQYLDENPAWSPDGSTIAFDIEIPSLAASVLATVNPLEGSKSVFTGTFEGASPRYDQQGNIFFTAFTAGGTVVAVTTSAFDINKLGELEVEANTPGLKAHSPDVSPYRIY